MHPTRRAAICSPFVKARSASLGHPWLDLDVLSLSLRLNQASMGAFDPCLPGAAGRLPDLEFAAPYFVIPHVPLHIDLGGNRQGLCSRPRAHRAACRRLPRRSRQRGGDLAVFANALRHRHQKSRRG